MRSKAWRRRVAKLQATDPWRVRVVEHALVDPGLLIAHPDNWRAHPERQQDAMLGAIGDLGFIGEVYVSKRSGRILDGHLRVALAIMEEQPSVPVGYVDCVDDAEEDRILASYDPLAALAVRDQARYSQLLERSPMADKALRDVLDDLILRPDGGKEAGGADGLSGAATPADFGVSVGPSTVPALWGVVVECADEEEQLQILERLSDEGYPVRALVS